jgi:hypothetical protein
VAVEGGADCLINRLRDGTLDLAKDALVDRFIIDIVCTNTGWIWLVSKAIISQGRILTLVIMVLVWIITIEFAQDLDNVCVGV